jgi:hypothetical protein
LPDFVAIAIDGTPVTFYQSLSYGLLNDSHVFFYHYYMLHGELSMNNVVYKIKAHENEKFMERKNDYEKNDTNDLVFCDCALPFSIRNIERKWKTFG